MRHVSFCLTIIKQAAYINYGWYIGQCLHFLAHVHMRFFNYIIYDDYVGSIASYEKFKCCLTSDVKMPKFFPKLHTVDTFKVLHVSQFIRLLVHWVEINTGAAVALCSLYCCVKYMYSTACIVSWIAFFFVVVMWYVIGPVLIFAVLSCICLVYSLTVFLLFWVCIV
jgi:hypothetical protein